MNHEEVEIELEAILIFLAFLIPEKITEEGKDGQGKVGENGVTQFDSIWPLNSDGEILSCSSPTATSSSPVRKTSPTSGASVQSPRSRGSNSPLASLPPPASPSSSNANSPVRTPVRTLSSPVSNSSTLSLPPPSSPSSASPSSPAVSPSSSSSSNHPTVLNYHSTTLFGVNSTYKNLKNSSQNLLSIQKKLPLILHLFSYFALFNQDFLNAASSSSSSSLLSSTAIGSILSNLEDNLEEMFEDKKIKKLFMDGDFSLLSIKKNEKINKLILNSFHYFLCGGINRDNIIPLTSLFLAENTSFSENEDSIPSHQLLEWIVSNLSINEIIYPPSISPSSTSSPQFSSTPLKITTPLASLSRFSPVTHNYLSNTTIIHTVSFSSPSRSSSFRKISRSTSSSDGEILKSEDGLTFDDIDGIKVVEEDDDDGDIDNEKRKKKKNLGTSSPQHPTSARLRTYSYEFINSASAPSSFSATSSPNRYRTNSNDLSSAISSPTRHRSYSREHLNLGIEQSQTRIEMNLPQVYLNYCHCSTFSFLSPSYTVIINGNKDNDITLGPVYGTVIIIGSEKIKISLICKKLILINSLNIDIYSASKFPILLLGETKGIRIAPYNSSFKSLKTCLFQAELSNLMGTKRDSINILPSNSPSVSPKVLKENEDEISYNWKLFIDGNKCLENSFYSSSNFSQQSSYVSSLNYFSSLSSSCSILPLNLFDYKVVSLKSEFVSFEESNLSLPLAYKEQLTNTFNSLNDTQLKIFNILQENELKNKEKFSNTNIKITKTNYTSDDATEEDEKEICLSDISLKLIYNSTLSNKFFQWMVENEKIHEVIDLIRIDSE